MGDLMAWSTSTRRSRLPADWPHTRAQVRQRAGGKCEGRDVLEVGKIGHAPNCDGRGNEADHITPGDDHRMTNLQWLSPACHIAKTKRENADARAAMNAARKRTEKHPGARPGG